MKKLWGIAISLVAVITLSAAPVAAHAQTISSQVNIITITATVGGQITVVVNQQGAITQIFSNSDQLVAPVYVSDNLEGARIQPTSAQIKEYEQLMQNKQIKYGSLYTKPTSPVATWLSILKRPAVTIGL